MSVFGFKHCSDLQTARQKFHDGTRGISDSWRLASSAFVRNLLAGETTQAISPAIQLRGRTTSSLKPRESASASGHIRSIAILSGNFQGDIKLGGAMATARGS